MRLPLREKAKEHCMTCHDLDNSPDFHDEDAFEDIYWPQVEHDGRELIAPRFLVWAHPRPDRVRSRLARQGEIIGR